jgi:hypothetical protein
MDGQRLIYCTCNSLSVLQANAIFYVADVIPTNIWGLAVGVHLAAKNHLNSFIYTWWRRRSMHLN